MAQTPKNKRRNRKNTRRRNRPVRSRLPPPSREDTSSPTSKIDSVLGDSTDLKSPAATELPSCEAACKTEENPDSNMDDSTDLRSPAAIQVPSCKAACKTEENPDSDMGDSMDLRSPAASEVPSCDAGCKTEENPDSDMGDSTDLKSPAVSEVPACEAAVSSFVSSPPKTLKRKALENPRDSDLGDPTEVIVPERKKRRWSHVYYAGSTFMKSPAPSELPLPGFFVGSQLVICFRDKSISQGLGLVAVKSKAIAGY